MSTLSTQDAEQTDMENMFTADEHGGTCLIQCTATAAAYISEHGAWTASNVNGILAEWLV